jgi:hypothetical protein
MATSSIISVSDKVVSVFGKSFPVDEDGNVVLDITTCKNLSNHIEDWFVKLEDINQWIQRVCSKADKIKLRHATTSNQLYTNGRPLTK